uniref:Uncharacterized protein n=1 Tax=Rhodococcus sp. NS1 TaxID=402236 RepID=A0A097SQH5_9NOCA|nr:hypothetical protein LRS1606.347 [Rhodococcus sp. NS1]
MQGMRRSLPRRRARSNQWPSPKVARSTSRRTIGSETFLRGKCRMIMAGPDELDIDRSRPPGWLNALKPSPRPDSGRLGEDCDQFGADSTRCAEVDGPGRLSPAACGVGGDSSRPRSG